MGNSLCSPNDYGDISMNDVKKLAQRNKNKESMTSNTLQTAGSTHSHFSLFRGLGKADDARKQQLQARWN